MFELFVMCCVKIYIKYLFDQNIGVELKFCDRRCNKKKTCGRHQCNEICCSDNSHLCTLVCNRMLNCGIHKCDQLCHKSGQCQRCLVASKYLIVLYILSRLLYRIIKNGMLSLHTFEGT